ncbi:hypothetical protein ACIG56_10560 [Nocardia fusca]|uniref:hypothetical protein n=1 Tax=Nocardia fusca TaxID=941183 RepID=UPI0037C6B5D7
MPASAEQVDALELGVHQAAHRDELEVQRCVVRQPHAEALEVVVRWVIVRSGHGNKGAEPGAESVAVFSQPRDVEALAGQHGEGHGLMVPVPRSQCKRVADWTIAPPGLRNRALGRGRRTQVV